MRFVHGEPALLLGDSLVIAELHIGCEQERFPGTDVFFTDKLVERVRALVRQTGAKRLVVNGDVKHSVRGVTPEEGRELARFFKEIGVPATVVKGNHDGGIERHLHEVEIAGQGGVRIGDAAVFHGNAWPSKKVAERAKVLVLAHSHPCVELDRRRLQCWLVGKLGKSAGKRFPNWRSLKVIVMPAFSQMVGCAPVNRGRRRMLGPLLRHEMFKLDEAEVYLLDGTCMGRVRDLRFRGD